MLGYSSPDDLLANGSTRGIVLDPESVAAANQTSANEGYLVQTEISWNRKDGVPLTIGLSGRLLRDEKGAPACFEMVAEDVTSRRRAEQRLRQLNRLYAVLSYTGQAIGRIRETTALCREICRVIVEQGHFTSAWIGQVQPESGQLENVALWASGDSIAPITGCGSHELTCCQAVRQAIRENRHIITRHTPPAHCTALDMNEPTDDMASAMAVFPVQVNDNPAGVITIRAVDPSLFDDENVALLDELASNLSFALTSLSRERMKQRTIEELNQFFVLSRDLLCIASMDGYIYRLNPAWERTLGYSLEEICRRPWVEFVHPEDRPSASAACAGFTAGRAVDQLELRFIPKDGPQRWLTASAIPLVERGIIFAVLRDVTERKKLDEQLRIKNLKLEEQNRRIQAHSRMKSEFLANMSHELRSPLNGIIGFTEVLYDGKLGQLPDRPRDLLSRVLKGAKHLLQLINGVLDLSKVEAGRLDVKGEPFGLSNVVQEVVASLDALASEKRIRIATNLAPEVEDLVGDPNRLKQILYNYLSNA